MDANANEPPTLMHWSQSSSSAPEFIKQSKGESLEEGYSRKTVQRKALGDKKNIPNEEVKASKAEGKVFGTEGTPAYNNFDVLCEDTSSESMLVDAMSKFRVSSETADEQFERIDPDAPIEGCHWKDNPEECDQFWMAPSRTTHSDEILHSVYTLMGTRSHMSSMFEDEILEEDVFETPPNHSTMSHLIKSSQESHRTIGEALVAGKQSLDDVQLCTPRRALGDMKNVFATPMKTEVVKKNPIPENERRRKTFGVLCEKHPLGEKGDAVEVDVSEQQFRNVDPDAPVESFSFAPLPGLFPRTRYI
ncbi:hypothetical protein Tcan_14051 [Toxocara canis]|uniref:Uncharacterized protein n=1 Tax=Toxocara canis TaxID=6265 RepID=A0A0B2VHT8_TOXCA|nr:hypothetical protein Tcan_14051 [Toxocara canis]